MQIDSGHYNSIPKDWLGIKQSKKKKKKISAVILKSEVLVMKESPEQGYGAKAHGSQVAESCGGVWAFGKIRLAETRPSKGATGRSKGLVFSDSPLSGKTSNLEFAVNFYDFEISNGGRASFHLSSKVPSPSEYSIFHPVLATEKLKGKLCYGDFWRSFPFLIKGTLSISVPGFLPGNWK